MINLLNISGYFLLIIAYQCLDGFTPVFMTLKGGGRFSLKAEIGDWKLGLEHLSIRN